MNRFGTTHDDGLPVTEEGVRAARVLGCFLTQVGAVHQRGRPLAQGPRTECWRWQGVDLLTLCSGLLTLSSVSLKTSLPRKVHSLRT